MIPHLKSHPEYFPFALLLSLCLWMVCSTPGHAQTATNEWSRPIPISGALSGSRYPSIVADDRGTLYLFWGLVQSGEGNTIFVSKYDGTVWLRPVDVLIGGPRSVGILDGRGIIQLLLNQSEDVTLANAPAEGAMSARGWNRGVTLTRTGGGEAGDMLIDGTGAVHTVWFQKAQACENCFSIAYQEFGGTTDPAATYHVLSDLEESPLRQLQLLGDPARTMYAIWDTAAREGLKAGIELTLSQNGGETWSDNPLPLRFNEEDIRQPLLFLDANNSLVLVFNFGVKDEVYFSVSSDNGETWTEPQAIPGLFASKESAPDDYFVAATDSAGMTHLIAAGRASKSQVESGLFHAMWDGTAWTNLEEIYRGNTTVEYPTIALSNGYRMHVSFATRDRNPAAGSGSDTSQVWYTTAQTGSPAATRVPLPTFTPTSTLTPSPQPTASSTSTPSPTPIALDTNDSGTDQSILNPQLPIIVAVGSVLLILVVVLAVNALLRRR